jgi:uncharacterized protein with PIN domain
MTLALDTSALLARYVTGNERTVVLAAMDADRDWCASALALAEALMLADRMTGRRAPTRAARRLGTRRRHPRR